MTHRVPIEGTLDLHTFAPRDVAAVVADYVAEAHSHGFAEVRLIHGRGIGVQRRAVQTALERHPLVLECWDAPESHLGATVARLAAPTMPPRLVPLTGFGCLGDDEMRECAAQFRDDLSRRRSVRQFSDRPVPNDVIDACLRVAVSAPSGANQQPWHFVVVTDPETKKRIRREAEEEERAFYRGRAPDDWLDAVAPLGTDEHKPFLEDAPCLIVVFAQSHGLDTDGRTVKHYYVHESVGIATGMLITAVHRAGLASLTHTPSPMRFLNDILDRPPHERPFLILVVGHPAADARVPNITRKPFDSVVTLR